MADKIQATGEITDGLFILNLGFVGMYLLKSGDSFIAFDTGMKVENVTKELERLQIEPEKVQTVLLTHSDRDHVGGLGAFPGAQVYLPKDEIAMVDKTTARFFGFIYNKPLVVSYQTLEDDQSVMIGETSIRCVATPGHTAGHMSFVVNDSILIAGDILNLSNGKIVMDRKFINIDNRRRAESIRRLASLERIHYLCTMHSGYTADFDTAAEEWK
jgi:glyoxylase-like metal-dependent hydrolase (beta-lactamase superfamily II)